MTFRRRYTLARPRGRAGSVAQGVGPIDRRKTAAVETPSAEWLPLLKPEVELAPMLLAPRLRRARRAAPRVRQPSGA